MKRLFLIALMVAFLMPVVAFAVEDDGVNVNELTYITGNNDTVATSFETVGDLSAVTNFLTTASTLEISSSRIEDAAGGTGAVSILLEGLDENYDAISETVTMAGQTSAVTVKYFLRVNKMTVASVGTFGTNVGDIYCHLSATTAGVPDTATLVYSMIQFGAGSSKIAVFTTPRKKRGIMKSIFNSASAAGAFRIKTRVGTGPWTIVDYTNTAVGYSAKTFGYFINIPAKSDVVVEALATASTIKASTNIEFRLKN